MVLSWHWVLVVTQIYRWSFWICKNNALITFCPLRNPSQLPCTSSRVINSALRVALPHHDMSVKLRLRFESSRVWRILMLGNRDELPLVMASGQRSATCRTAQPWAIKPDLQEHLKSAANQSPTWSANVIFSLSPDKFPTVHFPRTTREGHVATL